MSEGKKGRVHFEALEGRGSAAVAMKRRKQVWGSGRVGMEGRKEGTEGRDDADTHVRLVEVRG